MNLRFCLLALSLSVFFAGCEDSNSSTSSSSPTAADSTASFMVGSDLHYFSPGLMSDTSTAAFKQYLLLDRKMIVQSPALLHSFLDSVRAHKPKLLLLTGDLTKDGEKQSHQELADSLATLRKLGIKVYVIPGNHDVANPETYSYTSAGAVATANVTAAEFASIYHDCGFDQAIARDTASLSYVTEPVPGLWLFAMDPTRWRDNLVGGGETVGGRFLPQTVAWLKTQLDLAKANGKVPVGAMHHGILEHFTGQSTNPISSDYVVAGFDTLGPIFAGKGMRVVFTGHFHANDIASKTFSVGSLTDIETGSLVTSPSPFRLGSLSANGSLSVRSSKIGEIVGMTSFPTWSSSFLLTGMTQLSFLTLTMKFGVDSATANVLSPISASAYTAHYAGDERGIPAAISPVLTGLAASGQTGALLAGSVQALYSDLNPADSAGVFPLR